MSKSETEFNPFQAPEIQHEPDVPMSEDDEFLISDKVILCRQKVTLPRVCIHTGDTEDLVRRTQRLSTASGYAAFVTILVVVSLLIAPMVMGAVGLIIPLALLIIQMLINRFVLNLPFSGMVSVDVTWYVSNRYLKRIRWQKYLGQLLLMVISGVFGSVITGTSDGPVFFGIAVGAAIGFLISLGLDVEGKMTLKGCRMFGVYKGLMVLRGHSPPFADAVRRIIQDSF